MRVTRPSKTSSSNERARFRTEFGAALDAQLRARGSTQSALAQVLNLTPSYVNQTIRGIKSPSGPWVDLVADVMKVTTEERSLLHRAAARDHGYKID